MKSYADKTLALVLAGLILPVAFATGTAATAADPTETGPRLAITEPKEGESIPAPAALKVSVVGLGRYGGITDVELLLDGRVAAESHIRFIRAPEPDEPVNHEFQLTDVGVGSHTLVARESGGESVSSGPVTFRVVEKPQDPPDPPVPSLSIVKPQSGATFRLGEDVSVEAFGVGRFGGITHVELLLDGVKAAESQIVFIRAPEADEPVHHWFQLETPPPVGVHKLVVREVGNPALESPAVSIEVVAADAATNKPLLRLTSLTDGTLVLVLSGDEPAMNVEIQASNDLTNWESVGNGWPAVRNPVLKPSSALTTGTTKFYRAVPAKR